MERIRVEAGAGASLIHMASSPPLNGVVQVAFTDAPQLTAAICAAGSSAVVLEPEDMVHSVIAALDSIIASHEEQI